MESPNDEIREHAKFLARRSDEGEDVCGIILIMLYDLELPLQISGFGYLKNAARVAFERPTQISMKEIFNEVGKLYVPEASYSAIDTGIRDLLAKAWDGKNDEIWHWYFPDKIVRAETPPCNAELIAAMVYFLEMWQGYCKGRVKYARK